MGAGRDERGGFGGDAPKAGAQRRSARLKADVRDGIRQPVHRAREEVVPEKFPGEEAEERAGAEADEEGAGGVGLAVAELLEDLLDDLVAGLDVAGAAEDGAEGAARRVLDRVRYVARRGDAQTYGDYVPLDLRDGGCCGSNLMRSRSLEVADHRGDSAHTNQQRPGRARAVKRAPQMGKSEQASHPRTISGENPSGSFSHATKTARCALQLLPSGATAGPAS